MTIDPTSYTISKERMREFIMMALTCGMVLVPRNPTDAMLHAGEGITDFFLPDAVGPNTKERRMEEMRGAWQTMIEQWELELAVMIKNEMKKDVKRDE